MIVAAPFLPTLSLLLVEAYPTSYARSTTGFSVAAIARGQTLFGQQCAVCHDPRIGSGAASDLTAPHMWGHLDGEVFWWVTNGVVDPEGNALMPGFGSMLSEDDRWALIDYIHARNIGRQAMTTGKWSPDVSAPATPLNCDGGEADSLADIGSHDLLIAAEANPATGVAASIKPRSVPGAETIRLALDAAGTPGEGECVAASPDAWEAWRVLAGVPRDRFGGYRAVVDRQGWLRAWLPPGTGPEAALRDADDHPISTAARAGTGHKH
jgi:mono/diheme cytochrome c family protein